MSINFYEWSANNVGVIVVGDKEEALNSVGKAKYINATKDLSNFGIECGDNYVTSYYKGSLLLYALNLDFGSFYDREIF